MKSSILLLIKRYWFYLLLGVITLLALVITLLVYDPGEGAPAPTTPVSSSETTPAGTPPLSTPASESTADTDTSDSGTTAPTDTPPPSSAALPATIQTETRSLSLTYQNRTVVNANILFPQIAPAAPSDVINRINAVFTAVADRHSGYANEKLFAYAKDALASGGALPYRLSVDYAVKLNTRTCLSVVFTSTVFTGGASEHTLSSAVNVGADGRALTLSSLFKVSTETVQKRIWDAVITQIGDKTENYYADYKNLIKTLDLNERLYFTSEGLHVIYNPYELATPTEGILHFLLPYASVSDILGINPAY